MPTHRLTIFFVFYKFFHFFFISVCKKLFQSKPQKKQTKKKVGWKKPYNFEKTHQYQNISKQTKPAKYGVLLYSLNMLQLAHTAG